MGSIDEELADILLTHQIHLLRLEAGYQREIVDLLQDMERELVGKLSGKKPLTDYARQRLLDLLAETRSTIAQAYVAMRRAIPLQDVATMEAQFVAGRVAAVTKLDVAVPAVTTLRTLVSDLLIQGAPSSEWWSRQGQDTAFRFANAVRQGVAQGETNAQIVQRIRGTPAIPGILDVSRRNAEALVRSSVQTAANVSRLAAFRENDDVVQGVRQLSTLDSRTSQTCIAYSGGEWDLDGKPIGKTKLPFNGGPPRHWNCRSVLTPIVKPIDGLPEFRPGQRAAEGGPVRGDMTMDQWLSGKSKSFQDDLLGTGKAELWRDGKITLPQLLDQRGRPLTLEQLQERYL